ncbi:MAG: nucleobase:cation symporter, family [Frankiaceae bacterium]|jgi:putative hydroxymethylpyrimidine transporter CytX|nr:nucleobase:cation symporter, family [Frankiaceae bacterium]
MTATVERVSTLDSHLVEPPLTLERPPPRVLGWLDQIGLWANLGMSILGPAAALYVLRPFGFAPMSFVGAGVALLVGTILGTFLIAAAAVPGAETGAPSMVLLRGLFGVRLSYLPTLVNVVQLIGWAVFEIVVITQASQQLLPWHGVRWPYVVAAGALTTVMAIRPLGVVRVLRRYALVLVALATIYLYVQLLRHPMPSLTHGSWSGFFPASDSVIGAAVSFAPLASDYSRHSRSRSAAFGGAFVGYSVASLASYVLGLVALATVVKASSASLQTDMFAAFIAVPVGWLAFGVLVARELDQSFIDSYSTVISVQNVFPRFDRRILAIVIGAAATVFALALSIEDYYNFLLLLGSVFVPLTAVLLVDYFTVGRTRWDVSESAPARWLMVAPWVAGFVTYQLVNPGYVTWWVGRWSTVSGWLHFTPHSWMSASVLSFVVAAVLTPIFSALDRRSRRSAAGDTLSV